MTLKSWILIVILELLYLRLPLHAMQGDPFYKIEQIRSLVDLLQPQNLKMITHKTVILVDIDETMLIAKRNLRQDLDPSHLQGQAYIPIESITAIVFDILKTHYGKVDLDKQPIMIAVTKRSFRLQGEADSLGHVQLEQMDIALSRQAFQNYNGLSLSQTYPSIGFTNGVLYTNGQNKGYYTMKFLDHVGFVPDQIIMIDDLRRNLDDVYLHAKERQISMTSFLFTGADKYKRQHSIEE